MSDYKPSGFQIQISTPEESIQKPIYTFGTPVDPNFVSLHQEWLKRIIPDIPPDTTPSEQIALVDHLIQTHKEVTTNEFTQASTTLPITLDELLCGEYDLYLVTYQPRYSNLYAINISTNTTTQLFNGADEVLIGVMIAGNLSELAMMADDMTASGDYCQHIKHMLNGTPYFPWGEGHTFQEAVDNALARVNSISREQWLNYARYSVVSAPSAYPEIREQYVDWPPLQTIDELIAELQKFVS